MINIDVFKQKVWRNNALSKREIKAILEECFLQTNTVTKNVFLNVSFVDSKTITEYNLKYFGKNSTTNVLSFENKDLQGDIVDKNCKNCKTNINEQLFLGDIVLCYEKIKDEAREYNKRFEDRLYHLFIHGILHLLGYNHIKNSERKKMELLETEILLKFNIKDPFLYGK